MLSKECFKEQIENLMIFYPSWKINYESSETMLAWYNQFNQLTDGRFVDIVENHIQLVPYNPTVASLYDQY